MNTGAVVGQKMGRIEWEINKMAKVSASQHLCGRDQKKVEEALGCEADQQDSMLRDIRPLRLSRSAERLQGQMVHLCLSLSHPIFFHYTHQVSCLFYSRLIEGIS